MDDRGSRGVEQAARGQRVERTRQQPRVPAVEQVAREHEVIGGAGSDPIELAPERVQVGGIAQVRVGEVGDQQLILMTLEERFPFQCRLR